MSIPENVLKEIKCCLSNDDHIVIEPVLLSCDGNACNRCIYSFKESLCKNCSKKHDNDDVLYAPDNKMAKKLVEKYINEIFQDLIARLELIKEGLRGMLTFINVGIKFRNLIIVFITEESLLDELNAKLEIIENEIDLRVESIVSKAHTYGDELRMELNEFKENFQRYFMSIKIDS